MEDLTRMAGMNTDWASARRPVSPEGAESGSLEAKAEIARNPDAGSREAMRSK